MKRKFFVITLAVITFVCLLLSLSACRINTGSTGCSHLFSEWEYSEGVSCVSGGTRTHTCHKCLAVETEEVGPLGHEYSKDWACDENQHYHQCIRDNCTSKSGVATHTDTNNDHSCDICGTKVSDCSDENNDHNCDICGTKLSDCADNDNDHSCDICGTKLSDCADENNDHNCDICGHATSEHSYGDVTYMWNADNTACTAMRTCSICSDSEDGHTQTANGTIDSEVTQNKTCALPELTKYTATFTETWAETQTKENIETASALGHIYSETGTTDESGHYHSCTHENCVAKATDAEIDKNNDYACDICGEAMNTKLQKDVAALVGDGSKDSVDISLTLANDADSYVFSAIRSGLANAKDGSIDLTINGMETIPASAFTDCKKIKSVTLGDTVKKIGSYAFRYCRNLLVLTLGANLESIDSYAFEECSKLYEVVNNGKLSLTVGSYNNGWVACYAISVHSGERQLKELNGYLAISTDDGDMLVDYVGSETELVLPNKFVKDTYTIAKSAFERSEIVSITIPSSVTAIENKAFLYCSELTSIVIPSSVKTIGNSAFKNCDKLAMVTFSENSQVENIGDDAFSMCDALESIVIPSSVKTIGESVFENCDKLATVTFAENCQIEKISDYAFRGCSALKSIVIPSSVTTIGQYAFSPNQYGDTATSLHSVTFETGSKLTMIDEYAFYKCASLVSIVFPDSVTTIKSLAFYDCGSLVSVVLPDSVTTIGQMAFYDCTKLTTVTLGTNLTTIEDNAFAGCSKLIEVVNNSSLQIKADSYGENGRVADYAKYIRVGESQLRIQGDFVALCTDDGDTLIAYLGENAEVVLPNKFVKDTYAIGENVFKESKIVSITIPASVTTIGENAFYLCSNLNTVTFAESSKLSHIGECAFFNCSRLTGVAISTNGVEIADNAFYGCSELTTVTAANVKIGSVGKHAFSSCEKLTGMAFAANAKKIGTGAFFQCSALKTVTFDDNCMLETIGKSAFYLSGITSITIPSKVTTVESSAFSDCNELITVIFEENSELITIGDDAFNDCKKLSSIDIPSTVTSIGGFAFYRSGLTDLTFAEGSQLNDIGNYAFYDCKELNSIQFGGTKEQWNAITFGSYWKNQIAATEVVCTDGTVSL